MSLQQQFSQAADISLQRQLSAPSEIGLQRQVTSAQDIPFTRQLSTPAPQDLTQQAQQQQYTTNPQYQGPQFWGGCLCRDSYQQQQQQQQERSVCDARAFHVKMFPEKTDNRSLTLICFLLPIKVSREFDLLLCINYADICRWIRNLKETFLWSIITWPTLGKQNIQFQVVCWETVLSSTDLIHRDIQRYVMHNVYLNSPFVVMSDSKLKFESLSGYDRCCRYLTILRAP